MAFPTQNLRALILFKKHAIGWGKMLNQRQKKYKSKRVDTRWSTQPTESHLTFQICVVNSPKEFRLFPTLTQHIYSLMEVVLITELSLLKLVLGFTLLTMTLET